MIAQDGDNKSGTDAFDGWKPEWQGKGRGATPHALQEQHSPTTPVTLRQTGARDKQAAQRRITDARLWDSFSGVQQEAAQQIAFAFESMSQGLGFTTVNWHRLPGCRGANNAVEAREKLLADYVSWARECHRAGISHSMIIDVLVFGFSCRALDQDRRVRSGWSKRNLQEGLNLYCRMKGWNPG
ncbi:MAG: hypothetical protein JNM12_05675 [Alphaproteobacteria bacterium]|nr:hypothetical protein [Alphaproteobacteria bacterium]